MIGLLGFAVGTEGLTRRDEIAFLLEISFTLSLFGVFLFMRHWRRFSEFNADLTATLAGYGAELIDFLTTFPNSHTTRMKRLVGIHPAPSGRIRFIRRALADSKSLIFSRTSKGNLHIGITDYMLGTIIYIAPLWIFFTALFMLLLAVTGLFLQEE
jgi:hypothetical protein